MLDVTRYALSRARLINTITPTPAAHHFRLRKSMLYPIACPVLVTTLMSDYIFLSPLIRRRRQLHAAQVRPEHSNHPTPEAA